MRGITHTPWPQGVRFGLGAPPLLVTALITVPIFAGCAAVPAASSPAQVPTTATMTASPATPTTATVDPCAASGDSLTLALEDVVAIDPDERLDCFGDQALTFRGWVMFSERGGVCNGMQPQWLDPTRNCSAWEEVATERVDFPPPEGTQAITVFVDPEADAPGIPWPAFEQIEVTGSFDHPAAHTCTAPPGSTDDEQAQLVLQCRSQFVVTRAELVPAP